MMPEIYGSWADRRQNIVELGTLTAVGSTQAVEVSGVNFTFVHKTVGGNVKVQDEGSLNGVDWFPIDTEKTHTESGTDAHFYGPRILRYVRTRATAIDPGESVTVTVACD